MKQRVDVEVVRNGTTNEVRVIINAPLEFAQDLDADLARASICQGTHLIASALRLALRQDR